MGQASSQLVSTQAPEAIATSRAGTPRENTPAESEIRVAPNPVQIRAPTSRPKSTKKRSASTPANEDEIQVKKVKMDDEQPVKERKARRSMPQHRRGIAIRPSQDALAQELPKKNKRQKLNDLVVADQPTTANDDPSNAGDAVGILLTKTSGPQSDGMDEAGAGAIDERVVEPTMNLSVEDAEADLRTVVNDWSVVDPIGTSGPRKRKRKKAITNGSKDEETAGVEANLSMHPAEKLPVTRDMAAAEADAATNRNTERNKKSESSAPVSQQDDVSTTGIAEQMTTEKYSTNGAFAASRNSSEDGIIVNSSGKPGPQRRKKQKMSAPESPSKSVSELEDTGLQAQPQMANLDGLSELSTNNAGRQKKKKQKQKQAAAVLGSEEQKASRASRRRSSAGKKETENLNIDVDEDEAAQAIHVDHPSYPHIQDEARQGKSRSPQAHRMQTSPVLPSDVEEDAQGASGVEVDGGAHYPDYSPNDRENYVDPTDQVSTWMDSRESSAPPDQVERSQDSPVEKKSAFKRKRASRRRKDDSDEDRDDEQAAVESGFEPKSKRRKSKDAQKKSKPKRRIPDNKQVETETQRTGDERGSVNGPWTAEEKKLADDVFDRVCRQDRIKPSELKASIKHWTKAGSFRTDMNEAFPQRTIAAIRKFAIRRFASFERGPWTEEQDEALRRAYAAEPDKWTVISDWTGRAPEACRDRWRNILKYEGTLEAGPWSTDEEEMLIRAVRECMDIIQDNCEDEAARNDLDRLESMLEWNVVAQKMDGKRSKKRCYEKFQKLKQRQDSFTKTLEDRGWDATIAQSLIGLGDGQTSKKLKEIESSYKRFKPGDVYCVIAEIIAAIADPTKVYYDESTVWSIVAIKHSNSKFKSALRRRAYYDAIETYTSKKVKRAPTIAGKAKAVWKRMTKLSRKGDLVLAEGYKVDEEKETKKVVISRKSKSKGVVIEIDDDAEAGAGTDKDDDDDKGVESKQGDEVDEDQDQPGEVDEDPDELDGVDEDKEEPNGVDEEQGEPDEPDGDESTEMHHIQPPNESKMAQEDAAVDGDPDEMEVVDDQPWSSVNSRRVQSLQSESPGLGRAEFLARCKAEKKRKRRNMKKGR